MAELQQRKENKMGVMPVPKLLITMSLPMMLSMLVQAFYNVVDSIFVARISEDALTAVSLAFPIQNLMIAVASGTGVGINAFLSKSLGEKKYEEANKAAMNGLFLALLSSILFALFGLFGARTYFSMQTDNMDIISHGTQYMSVITIVSIGIFGAVTLERLLQATGNTFYTMITQGIGAIINIVFDPILIFGLLGFPKMGVAGAAVATVMGQIVAMILAYWFNMKRNPEITIKWRGFRPSGRIIKIIYKVGIPSIIMMAIGSVMTYGYNKILLMFSSTAVSVFGIYFKLNSFVFMPVFGLNNGMIPILAYNYGARNKKRIIDTIKLSVIIACVIMFLGFVLFQVAPEPLLQMFNASEHMMEIGVPALRIISICFIFAGYSIILSAVFQAFGNGMFSLIISVVRQIVVILPSAYILAICFGLNQVWWSFPLAEIASVVLSTMFLRHLYLQKIKNIEED
ncbi:MATE family efflux transporter [Velocimicrobium porci]|uniref:MATE family efflux transporter n=1 Tax=Velocimicrobium porci TaxID=2606634 RepID=A0A6L5XV72_9FIRM|nr:MATE family efflux transporter [Velocimicrobium porci]MSS62407.1 MATE family efflux transporter [Velocimicrobium porci]